MPLTVRCFVGVGLLAMLACDASGTRRGGGGDAGSLPACVAVPEECNARDDDCDGALDEDGRSLCGRCSLCRETRFGPPEAPFDEPRARAGGLRIAGDGALEIDASGGSRRHLIWIVNTPEGTVSKVDTRTHEELGRYLTGPNGTHNDPSRTSVDARGDATIGNRNGMSVTKISARGIDCPDTNGDGVVTTSSGHDVLPWGLEDCVLWNTALGDSPIRGVAVQEVAGPDGAWEPAVWVASTARRVYKLDGVTGRVLLETEAPVQPYGLALDARGNLWVAPHGQESSGGHPFGGGGRNHVYLGRIDTARCVDEASCEVAPCGDDGDGCVKQRIEVPDAVPGYGITVDRAQRVWLGGLAVRRYDPSATPGTRFSVTSLAEIGRMGTAMVNGIAADGEGNVWGALMTEGVLRMSADEPSRMTLVDGTEESGVKGIAVDHDNRVWAISQTLDQAFVLSPGPEVDDTAVEPGVAPFVVAPYVYSDMTGVQLELATGIRGLYRELVECGEAEGTAPRWVALAWDATVPEGTSLLFRVRTAPTLATLATAPWVSIPHDAVSPVYLEPLLSAAGIEGGRTFEVEVLMAAWDALEPPTPSLRSFTVAHVCPSPLI